MDTIFDSFLGELEKIAISKRKLQELVLKSKVPSTKEYLERRLRAKDFGQSPSGRNLGELMKSPDKDLSEQGFELKEALDIDDIRPPKREALGAELQRFENFGKRTLSPSQRGSKARKIRLRRNVPEPGEARLKASGTSLPNPGETALLRYVHVTGTVAGRKKYIRPKTPLQYAAQVARIEKLRKDRGLPPIAVKTDSGELRYPLFYLFHLLDSRENFKK